MSSMRNSYSYNSSIPFHPYKHNNCNNGFKQQSNAKRQPLSIIYEEQSQDSTAQFPLLNHPAFRGIKNNNNSSTISNSYGNPNEILNSKPLVLLTSKNGPQSVLMSILHTSTDHFAFVYRYDRNHPKKNQASHSVPLCCINLRGVRIEKTETRTTGDGTRIFGFTLRPKNLDYVPGTTSLMFICPDEYESESEVQEWIMALSSSSSSSPESSQDEQQNQNSHNQHHLSKQLQRKSSMPSVEEEDEELLSSEEEEE